ncbi:hypothetical protein SAMN04487957_101150 [Halomonas shengliensis]|uniref:Uncharacterized protein n=1 Tax=Halomonas shengliensis TaxID=419597 RepID=A0A1H0CTS9_9GAMM|nr:hypothetical protein SAMN04487957_101150 [Halomonas shengliensis]
MYQHHDRGADRLPRYLVAVCELRFHQYVTGTKGTIENCLAELLGNRIHD